MADDIPSVTHQRIETARRAIQRAVSTLSERDIIAVLDDIGLFCTVERFAGKMMIHMTDLQMIAAAAALAAVLEFRQAKIDNTPIAVVEIVDVVEVEPQGVL